jgi:hypothetical protein
MLAASPIGDRLCVDAFTARYVKKLPTSSRFATTVLSSAGEVFRERTRPRPRHQCSPLACVWLVLRRQCSQREMNAALAYGQPVVLELAQDLAHLVLTPAIVRVEPIWMIATGCTFVSFARTEPIRLGLAMKP